MTVTTQMANQEEVERKAWEQHLTVPEPQDAHRTSWKASGFSARSLHASTGIHGGNSFIGTILMSPSYTGAMLEQLNAQLATFFGSANGKGLLVRSVSGELSPPRRPGCRQAT